MRVLWLLPLLLAVLAEKRQIQLSHNDVVVLENPGAPEPSPQRVPLDLEWQLTAPSDSRIVLQCDRLTTFGTEGQCDEYLLNVDGGDGVKAYCGNLRPFTEMSLKNEMNVRFKLGKFGYGILSCKAKVQAEEEGEKHDDSPSVNVVELNLDDDAYLMVHKDGVTQSWTLMTKPSLKVGVVCDDVRFPASNECYKYGYGAVVNNGATEETVCTSKSFISVGNRMDVEFKAGRGGGSARCRGVALETGLTADRFMEVETVEFDSSEHGTTPGRKGTTCPCGWANREASRIHGGEVTAPNEYSFIVSIVYNGAHTCGGSILTKNFILTAAHCGLGILEEYEIYPGTHDLRKDNEDWRQRHEVAEIILHEKYVQSKHTQDIAIFRLKTPIEFNQKVGPACLPKQHIPNLNNKLVKLIGWGLTESGMAYELKKGDVRIVDPVSCSYTSAYDNDPKNPDRICVFSNNTDFCSGDSGGPIVWLDPETNRYVQLGAVSNNKGCRVRHPSVATSIEFYLDWIEKTIGGPGCSKSD